MRTTVCDFCGATQFAAMWTGSGRPEPRASFSFYSSCRFVFFLPERPDPRLTDSRRHTAQLRSSKTDATIGRNCNGGHSSRLMPAQAVVLIVAVGRARDNSGCEQVDDRTRPAREPFRLGRGTGDVMSYRTIESLETRRLLSAYSRHWIRAPTHSMSSAARLPT